MTIMTWEEVILEETPAEAGTCECRFVRKFDTEVSCFGWYEELVSSCGPCTSFDRWLEGQLSTAASGHLLNGLPLDNEAMQRLGVL